MKFSDQQIEMLDRIAPELFKSLSSPKMPHRIRLVVTGPLFTSLHYMTQFSCMNR